MHSYRVQAGIQYAGRNPPLRTAALMVVTMVAMAVLVVFLEVLVVLTVVVAVIHPFNASSQDAWWMPIAPERSNARRISLTRKKTVASCIMINA